MEGIKIWVEFYWEIIFVVGGMSKFLASGGSPPIPPVGKTLDIEVLCFCYFVCPVLGFNTNCIMLAQLTFICSMSATETLEKGVKYVHS